MRASKQQQTIIDAIKGGNNVYTDAVQIAGKSTSSLLFSRTNT